MQRPGPGAYALLLALSLVWGGSFMFVALAIGSIPPVTLTLIRLTIAGVILAGIALLAGQTVPRGRRIWITMALAGLFGNVLPFSLINWGQQVIDSGLAAILMSGMPLMTLVMAHVVTEDEKLNGRKFTGVLCGLLGLIVLIGPDKLLQLGEDAVRQLAVAGASVCYAINAIIIRRATGVPAKMLAACVIGISVPMTLPVALLLEQPFAIEPTATAAVAAITLGIVHTALATIMMLILVKGWGSTFFSQINFLVPLFGVAYGMVFLSERPAATAFISLGLILAGIAIARSGGLGAR